MNKNYAASIALLILLLQAKSLICPPHPRQAQRRYVLKTTPQTQGRKIVPQPNHSQEPTTIGALPPLPQVLRKISDDDGSDEQPSPAPHATAQKTTAPPTHPQHLLAIEDDGARFLMLGLPTEPDQVRDAFLKQSMRRKRKKKIALGTLGSLAALGVAGTSMWAGIQYGVIDPRNKLEDQIEKMNASPNQFDPAHYEEQTNLINTSVADITNKVSNLSTLTNTAQNAASIAEANKNAANSASNTAQAAATQTPPDTRLAASQASAAQYAADQAAANAQVAQAALNALTSQTTSINTQAANAQQSAQNTIDQVNALKTQLDTVKTAAEASKTAAQTALANLTAQTAAAQNAVNTSTPLATSAANAAALAQKYSTNATDAAAGRPISFPGI